MRGCPGDRQQARGEQSCRRLLPQPGGGLEAAIARPDRPPAAPIGVWGVPRGLGRPGSGCRFGGWQRPGSRPPWVAPGSQQQSSGSSGLDLGASPVVAGSKALDMSTQGILALRCASSCFPLPTHGGWRRRRWDAPHSHPNPTPPPAGRGLPRWWRQLTSFAEKMRPSGVCSMRVPEQHSAHSIFAAHGGGRGSAAQRWRAGGGTPTAAVLARRQPPGLVVSSSQLPGRASGGQVRHCAPAAREH